MKNQEKGKNHPNTQRHDKKSENGKKKTAQTTLSTFANTRQRRQRYCCIIYLVKHNVSRCFGTSAGKQQESNRMLFEMENERIFYNP